jgi:hypothetical protein
MPPEEMLPADDYEVITVRITCPQKLCRTEFEGQWIAPDERGEEVAPSLQLCPECGHIFDAEYPGYSFTAEA